MQLQTQYRLIKVTAYDKARRSSTLTRTCHMHVQEAERRLISVGNRHAKIRRIAARGVQRSRLIAFKPEVL
jgi:hypothetical protein